ncbi:MAG: carboxypeptidase regulatory-like domain-containing protein [Dehalococcoidia bacterium]|nr:carboxypeptidase regulatory-like domain-containing protein [Dehalococcoidia bacterium]
MLPGDTFCRFRFSSDGELPYYGPADDGEVEDYMVKIFIAIDGKTGEVNCDVLGGVTLGLWDGETLVGSTTSDSVNGEYILIAPASGSYTVVASKTGFRDRQQDIAIAADPVTLDFTGETGLIPNACDMSYVLTCVNHWLYPVGDCGLNMSTVLAVVNAWLYPQPGPR